MPPPARPAVTDHARPPLPFRAMRPDEADLRRFQDCFEANGTPRDWDQLRWQYLDNPNGPLLVDFAVDPAAVEPDGEARLAGIYAALPFAAQVDGTTRMAAQALDVLTDEGYRGRGLFTGLARSLYARCAAEGSDFVFGFPNANTANGYWTRLDWTSLDPVPFLIRPLRTRYLVQRLPGLRGIAHLLPDLQLPLPAAPRLPAGREIRAIAEFGPEFDALWETFAPTVGVAVRRDARYLRWRLGEKPHENYHTHGLFAGGRLLGFVTYCVKSKHGGHVGYLMELMHDPAERDAGHQLARFAVREMARLGADVSLAWNFEHSPTHAAHRAAGFRFFPEWARPIELHFGVLRAFDPALQATITDRTRWYLSYCDSDTV